MSNPVPHPVDLHVGGRIRLKRKLAQISQADLAAAIGVTFQQLQKYEKGANRISASKLFQLAIALKTPPAWFFADLPGDDRQADDPAAHRAAVVQSFLAGAEGFVLAQAFPRLSPRQRRQIVALAASLAED